VTTQQLDPLNTTHFSDHSLVILSISLLLSVRCKSSIATKQLLAHFYHTMDPKLSKTFMNRSIMLLEPKERDWLRDLV